MEEALSAASPAPPAQPKATKAAQPKKAAPPAKDGTTKRKGFGYIGKRKEAKYEDVGDAKQRVAAKNAQSSHVGGAVVLDAAWCPEGWTVETFTRGPQDKSAGTTYNVWHAPDGAKYRSKKSVERRVAADAARERLIASGGGDPAALEALAALDSGDAATRAMEAKTRYVPVSTDPAVLALAGAFFRDGVCCLDAPYLEAAQIDRLKAATFSFYEAVMRTVTARSLHHDLAVGFDVFRERGRGRFDMNPPFVHQRDEQQFDADVGAAAVAADANWRPVVTEVLGGGATELIAAGVFMSLPGAESQDYHTDGVHLDKRKHALPHAVNVFVPLVDLTLGARSNGPTEFTLGSHVLGDDAWDAAKSWLPAPKAGTAIVFDYRVGHRGMGNKSDEPRPTLYLTYTNKPGWTDKDNFSRARFKKLGELVGAKPSRAERAAARRG